MRVVWGLLLLVGCGGRDYTFVPPDTEPDLPGDARIAVSATSIDWYDIEGGKAVSKILTLENPGDKVLRIDRAYITGIDANQFYAPDYKDLTVATENAEKLEFTIVCAPGTTRKVDAIFRIDSNATDTPEFDIPLTGYPVGWVDPDTDTDTVDTDTDTP